MRTLAAPHALTALTLVVTLAASLNAQATWIVASDGSGNFLDIQSAVDAASPGDSILVLNTAGGTYAGATIGKGVALLGQGPAQITLFTDLVISGVPAGERVSVENFRMHESGNPTGGRPVRCQSNSGTVHLERITSPGSQYEAGLFVNSCSHVTAESCAFDAGYSTLAMPPVTLFIGNIGVACQQSSLLLVNSTVRGHDEFRFSSRTYSALLGAVIHSSTVLLVNCDVTGGNAPCPVLCGFGFPAIAMVATASTIVATGPSTSIRGGGYSAGCPCTPAPGIFADDGTVVYQDPASTISAMNGGQPVLQHVPYMTSVGAGPGGTLSLTLSTVSGAAFAMVGGFPGGPLAAPPVGIWLEVSQAIVLLAGSTGGQATVTFGIPNFIPLGLPASFQSLVLINGNPLLSTPTCAVLH